MKLHQNGNGELSVIWGRIGKAVVGLITISLPALVAVCVGIYVRVLVMENNQRNMAEQMLETRQAIAAHDSWARGLREQYDTRLNDEINARRELQRRVESLERQQP